MDWKRFGAELDLMPTARASILFVNRPPLAGDLLMGATEGYGSGGRDAG